MQFLRIADHLIADIVGPALRPECERQRDFIVKEFKLCKVGISFYTRVDETNNITSILHSTITGTDHKHLLQNIDLSKFYQGPELAARKILWAVFDRLIVSLHSDPGHAHYLNGTKFRFLAQQFSRAFEFVDSRRYKPYMHAMTDHVPFFLDRYGSLYRFSCQALENMHKVWSHCSFV